MDAVLATAPRLVGPLPSSFSTQRSQSLARSAALGAILPCGGFRHSHDFVNRPWSPRAKQNST